ASSGLRVALLQLGLEGAALLGGVEPAIVVSEGARTLHVQSAEHGPLLRDHVPDLLLEGGEFGKIVDVAVARRAGDAGEIHFLIRNRMAPVRLVATVVADEMDEVLRRDRCNGDE